MSPPVAGTFRPTITWRVDQCGWKHGTAGCPPIFGDQKVREYVSRASLTAESDASGVTLARARTARTRSGAKLRRMKSKRRCRADRRRSGQPDQPADGVGLDAAGHALRTAVGQKGVDRVLQFEMDQGRQPREMPPLHPGYDVESIDVNGTLQRTIEVKALEGAWTAAGVGLTKLQFECARRLRQQYWLYVVEYALDDSRFRIHAIPDPYGQVDRVAFAPEWRHI